VSEWALVAVPRLCARGCERTSVVARFTLGVRGDLAEAHSEKESRRGVQARDTAHGHGSRLNRNALEQAVAEHCERSKIVAEPLDGKSNGRLLESAVGNIKSARHRCEVRCIVPTGVVAAEKRAHKQKQEPPAPAGDFSNCSCVLCFST
jgi:hypothetical protein